MNPYVELARPLNGVMASFSALLGMLVVLGPDGFDSDLLLPILLALPVPFLVTAGGNALNDYMDQDVDREAHPERPIPSGRLSPDKALGFSIACFVVAQPIAGAAAWLGPSGPFSLLIEVMAVACLFAYELAFKYRGLVGNLTISLLTALTLLYGAAVVAEPYHEGMATVMVLCILAFFANAGREVTKDIEDMEGDRGSRSTLPLTSNSAIAATVAASFVAIAVLLSPVPYWPLATMEWPYLAMVLVADVAFLYSLSFLTKDPGRAQGSGSSTSRSSILRSRTQGTRARWPAPRNGRARTR
jgi:geranylgeranylglycerol-phosphate geranylgeranyltransferase